MPVNSYWVFMSEAVRYQGHPTTISLFYNVVFTLCVLLIANAGVRRLWPSYALSQGELLTVYVMLNISTAIVGHDAIQILIPSMMYPFYFATRENGWNTLFADAYPQWLTVRDPAALKAFQAGQSSIYLHQNWSAWLVPVLCWSGYIMVLLFVYLCINVLLRKQWTESERLTYPLVQLPLDMTAERAPLFRNGLLWLGFGIAAAIDIVNGLHYLYPSIPEIRVKAMDLGPYLTTRPWNAMGFLPMGLYPFAIGLGMIVPTDLSFSCWFFFMFWKAEQVMSAVQGWDSIPNFPFVNEQGFGAYMGICLFAIWASRRHLARIGRSFLSRTADGSDAGEAISYRAAAWGVIIGIGLLLAFSIVAGMSVWLACAYLIFFLALAISITRLRAEFGVPVHDLHYGGPDTIIPEVVGTSSMGTRNLGMLSMYWSFNRAYRAHPMPFQLEGMKAAEQARMGQRKLFAAMIVAAVVGTLVAFWVALHLTYHYGASAKMSWVLNYFGSESADRLDQWLRSPKPPDRYVASAVGIGFLFTLMLNAVRVRFVGFPFHPVGFAISGTWGMSMLWFPMLVAWVIKVLVLRYGGLRLYRTVLPFFLGIILGECVVGGLWAIIGFAFGIPSYAFWP